MDRESKNCGGVKPITGSQAVRQTIKKTYLLLFQR
jgi:hypothetical protein